MAAIAVALWRGVIPIEWLASLGYTGIFFLSLINGVAPVAGPSQIATFFVASKLNPLMVGIAAGLGGAIGELAGYAFGYFLRAAQSPTIEMKIQRIANLRLLRISREHSFIPLFVLATIPNPFFDPASALAGSLRIRFLQYFIPVFLGKTVRHLAIAYAGYYMISMNIILTRERMMLMDIFLNPGWTYVLAVVGIAIVAWLVRSVAESDPDPFLLNFTLFAFAGQSILTAELIREGNPPGIILLLLIPAVIILFLQIIIIRSQFTGTIEHYIKVLTEAKKTTCTNDEIQRWASVLVRITGVDYYPEFYLRFIKGVRSPRESRRKQAVSILPHSKFNHTALESDRLLVPPENRQFLWRCYAAFCACSWIIFIICIINARWPR